MVDGHKDKTNGFWRHVALRDMTPEQWESLCDGCGRCCLEKLEDSDTGEIAYTDVPCSLLDGETCRCSHYDQRARLMPDCVGLSVDNIETLSWMPSTCAYRLLSEGRDLPDWHPLVSGDPETVYRAGISVRGRISNPDDVVDLENHIVTWPE